MNITEEPLLQTDRPSQARPPPFAQGVFFLEQERPGWQSLRLRAPHTPAPETESRGPRDATGRHPRDLD